MASDDNVHEDVYRCPICRSETIVADLSPRAAVGHKSTTVRCRDASCIEEAGAPPAMERIE